MSPDESAKGMRDDHLTGVSGASVAMQIPDNCHSDGVSIQPSHLSPATDRGSSPGRRCLLKGNVCWRSTLCWHTGVCEFPDSAGNFFQVGGLLARLLETVGSAFNPNTNGVDVTWNQRTCSRTPLASR
jgi:hypothetical protein